ncbi:MAG TPA: carboxypeptidase regulatory-like domain-containing protein [Bryobacteraceae bacterium]|nr:carboxypeptidase regulatory-like domain-containing protein [Bryobacteraceae bacterium]
MPANRPFVPLLFLAAALVSYPQEKKLVRLEGRTVNSVTGEVVRKVKLTLSSGGQEGSPASATSDAEGRFVFADLEPGTYTLRAEKIGYIQQAYGAAQGAFSVVPITLAGGQEKKDLEFKLVPQAIIAGKVLDEEGEPVGTGASVSVFRASRQPGRRPMPMGGSMTNDLGEFRVANLSPGRYLVSANPAAAAHIMLAPGAEGRPKAAAHSEAVVTTYFPGVTDAGAAEAVEVKAGQELSGVEIPLQKMRVYRIEGKVVGLAAGQSPRDLRIITTPRARNGFLMGFSGAGGAVKADGSFAVENVAPGNYHLSIMSMGAGMPHVLGSAPVDVSNADVKDLTIPVLPPLQLSGLVRTDGSRKTDYGNASIMLSSDGGMMFGVFPARVGADGTFKFESVAPAKYDVMVMGLDDTVYLKSVRAGKQEVLEEGLDLIEAQGNVAVELVLGTRPGTVEGVVRRDGKPVPGVGVTMLPDSKKAAQRQFMKFANTDQNGHYTLKGAAPGNYKLYPLMDSTSVDLFFDPDAMQSYEDNAVKITVEEGATARMDLTVAPAS